MSAASASDSDEERCLEDYKKTLKTAHEHADNAIQAARDARHASPDSRIMRLAGFRSQALPSDTPLLPMPVKAVREKRPSGGAHRAL